MNVDLDRVRHVARLAELSLTSEEEPRLAAELSRIVTLFAELDSVDTTDVPPTTHITGDGPSESTWRHDAACAGLPHDEALRGAPCVEQGGFAVPGFVE
jgi:aspartyl-tRNA(Asn)/glutamyl-tRNA(Gln) amidotransferase subunit C